MEEVGLIYPEGSGVLCLEYERSYDAWSIYHGVFGGICSDYGKMSYTIMRA